MFARAQPSNSDGHAVQAHHCVSEVRLIKDGQGAYASRNHDAPENGLASGDSPRHECSKSQVPAGIPRQELKPFRDKHSEGRTRIQNEWSLKHDEPPSTDAAPDSRVPRACRIAAATQIDGCANNARASIGMPSSPVGGHAAERSAARRRERPPRALRAGPSVLAGPCGVQCHMFAAGRGCPG